VTGTRRGRGADELVLSAGELPKGVAILRIETPERSYARLVSR
jgi:hypothetical protein